jgi:hypothetical protein
MTITVNDTIKAGCLATMLTIGGKTVTVGDVIKHSGTRGTST